MSPRKFILLLVAFTGVVFPLLYSLAVTLGGAGHGTTLFHDGLLSPFSLVSLSFVPDYRVYIALAFVFWVLVAVLVGLHRNRGCLHAVISLLALHYLGVAVVCSQEDWSYLPRVWHACPGVVILFLGGYFAFQLAFWFLTWRKYEPHALSTKEA